MSGSGVLPVEVILLTIVPFAFLTTWVGLLLSRIEMEVVAVVAIPEDHGGS